MLVGIDDTIKLIGALAAGFVLVLSAIGKLYNEVQKYRQQVNGRLDELLNLTAKTANASGRATGVDEAAAQQRAEAMAYQAGKAAGIAQATAVKRWMAGHDVPDPTPEQLREQNNPPPRT